MIDTRDALTKSVLSTLDDVDEAAITDDVTVGGLGGNSLDRVDVIIATLDILGIKADLMDFVDARTLGEIADVIDAKRA